MPESVRSVGDSAFDQKVWLPGFADQRSIFVATVDHCGLGNADLSLTTSPEEKLFFFLKHIWLEISLAIYFQVCTNFPTKYPGQFFRPQFFEISKFVFWVLKGGMMGWINFHDIYKGYQWPRVIQA